MTEQSLLDEAAHRMEFSKQLEASRLEFSRQWEAARQRGDQRTLEELQARAPVAARYLDAISTRGLEVVSVAAPGVGSRDKKDSPENRTPSATSQTGEQSEHRLRTLGMELQELLEWSSVVAPARAMPQDLTEVSTITESNLLPEERRPGEVSDMFQLLEKWESSPEPLGRCDALELSGQTEEERSAVESELQPESIVAAFFIGTPDSDVDANTTSNSSVSHSLPECIVPQDVAGYRVNTPPQEFAEKASLAELGAAAVAKLTGVLEAASLESEKLGAVEELGAVAERLARALEEAEEPDAEVEPSLAKEPLCLAYDQERAFSARAAQAADGSGDVSHPEAAESMEEAAEEEPNCLESNLEALRRASTPGSASQDVKWSLAEKQNEAAANILRLTERLQASVAKYRSSNEGLREEFRGAEAMCERVVTASRPQAASSSSQAAPMAASPRSARAEGTVQEEVRKPQYPESSSESAAAETSQSAVQEAAEEPRCLESTLEALRAEVPRGAVQEANWGMAEKQHEVVYNIMKLTERLEATMAKYRTSNEGLREGFRGAEASCGRLSLVRDSPPQRDSPQPRESPC